MTAVFGIYDVYTITVYWLFVYHIMIAAAAATASTSVVRVAIVYCAFGGGYRGEYRACILVVRPGFGQTSRI